MKIIIHFKNNKIDINENRRDTNENTEKKDNKI